MNAPGNSSAGRTKTNASGRPNRNNGLKTFIGRTLYNKPRLIAGAAVFGIGWGMSGLCPGPAIASLAFGLVPPAVFGAAMIAGILIHVHWPAIRELAAKRFLVRQSSGKAAGGLKTGVLRPEEETIMIECTAGAIRREFNGR